MYPTWGPGGVNESQRSHECGNRWAELGNMQGSRKHAHVSGTFFAAVKWNCSNVKWNWNSGEKNWGGARARAREIEKIIYRHRHIWNTCVYIYIQMYIYIYYYIWRKKTQKENQNTISTQRGRHAYTGTGAAQWRGSYVKAVACCVWWHPMEVYRAANIHGISASDLGLCSGHHHWTIGRIVSGAAFDWAHCQSVRRSSEGGKTVAKKRCNVQLSFVEHVNQRTWLL